MSKRDSSDDPVPMMFPSEYVRGGQPLQRAAEPPAPEPRGSLLEIRLHVPAEPNRTAESFRFRQQRIVIGRDPACDLPLDDPRRVASSRHAELVWGGSGLTITDLGSKNFTLLNGERLEAGEPSDVQPGDSIEIAGFELELWWADDETASPPATESVDHTVYATENVNPFREEVGELAELLRRLAECWESEAPRRRQPALEDALREALGRRPGHEAWRALGRLLAEPGSDS